MYKNKNEIIQRLTILRELSLTGRQDIASYETTLFVLLKYLRRHRKGTHDSLRNVTVLDHDSFVTLFQDRVRNLHINKKIDAIFFDEGHCYFLSIKLYARDVTIFIFDQFDALASKEKIKIIQKIFPRARIFLYGSNVDLGTFLQVAFGCFWFTLQTFFRLSKIDFFPILQNYDKLCKFRNHDIKRYFIEEYKQPALNWSNINIITPETMPPKLAALFIPTQYSATYWKLEQSTRKSVVSSKGATLEQVLSHKHYCGQLALGHPTDQISHHWPNKASGHAHHNHAILYFKLKQIDTLMAWIKILPEHLVNRIVAEIIEPFKLGDFLVQNFNAGLIQELVTYPMPEPLPYQIDFPFFR